MFFKSNTMLHLMKAHASGLVSILLSVFSITVNDATTILTAIAAVITACFAAYHYLQLARLNRTKRKQIENDPTRIDPDS